MMAQKERVNRKTCLRFDYLFLPLIKARLFRRWMYLWSALRTKIQLTNLPDIQWQSKRTQQRIMILRILWLLRPIDLQSKRPFWILVFRMLILFKHETWKKILASPFSSNNWLPNHNYQHRVGIVRVFST